MGLWFFSAILHPPAVQVHAVSASLSCNGENSVVPVTNRSLELLKSLLDEVMWPSTLEFIASRNLFSVSYHWCRYGTVVFAASVCDPNNKTDCNNAVVFDNTTCSSVSRCPTGDSDYFLSADCTGISSDFPSCRLVCKSDSSLSPGITACASDMSSNTSTKAPTSSGWTTSARSGVKWVLHATLFLFLVGLVQ